MVDPCLAEAITRAPPGRATGEVLVGIYCSADCTIDAWVRGFPAWYVGVS